MKNLGLRRCACDGHKFGPGPRSETLGGVPPPGSASELGMCRDGRGPAVCPPSVAGASPLSTIATATGNRHVAAMAVVFCPRLDRDQMDAPGSVGDCQQATLAVE